VSALTGNDWNVNQGGAAAEMSTLAARKPVTMRQRVAAVRDTLIVLGMQIVFRVTMFLRHLNY
jgi:hypothetical protein